MLDFLRISIGQVRKSGPVEATLGFKVRKYKDLMTRSGDFYAIWVEDKGLWSTSEDTALNLIDAELDNFVNTCFSYAKDIDKSKITLADVPDLYLESVNTILSTGVTRKKLKINYTWDSNSGSVDKWHKYVKDQLRENYVPLDNTIIFSDQITTRESYASKKLPYSLSDAPTPNWEEMISVLYSPEERHKIEWVIGSIVSGDSRDLQKFMVLYGEPGSGKSTIIHIIEKLFTTSKDPLTGYFTAFRSASLGNKNDNFALETFSSNPLIAIEHDGDMSKIDENSRMNSLISHEYQLINPKNKSAFMMRCNSFLIIGTNKPVRITDARSGLLRRLIDVKPSGNKIPNKRYFELFDGIDYELGGIAYHCLNVYKENPHAYDQYVPLNMMGATNDMYNFMLERYDTFKRLDEISLNAAKEMYDEYCESAGVPFKMSKLIFKEELKSYFREFKDRAYDSENKRVWVNMYKGFMIEKFDSVTDLSTKEEVSHKFIFTEQESLFDKEFADYPAQYATATEAPKCSWVNCKTKLRDISSKKLHYVNLPDTVIVIDFDLKDENGKKCFEKNLKEAEKWPPTYAELSKSGEGIHLHYYYNGDPSELSLIFDKDIEVKVFTGGSSLRRKLTKCNDIPISTLTSGLPKKRKNKVTPDYVIKDDEHLRNRIMQCLRKEKMAGTVVNMRLIGKTLDEVYESGLTYDISDLKSTIYNFAEHSTNHKEECLAIARRLHYKSDDPIPEVNDISEKPIAFFDIEVFKNVNMLCYKVPLVDDCNRLVNPTPDQINDILSNYRLVGFNCRRYDNHILHAMKLGWTPEQIFELSSKIVNTQKGSKNSPCFGVAYNYSYTDIYDYAATKQSLKKWELQLSKDHHLENQYPWDEPLDKEHWDEVLDYCCNDVMATELVWNATQPDFKAREILVELCKAKGIIACVNDTTNTLTTKLIFGDNKKPTLHYTDLSEQFKGYKYVEASDSDDKKRHNMYKGIDVGFGGYVYAKPGMNGRVKCNDVRSMQPHSLIALDMLGQYTKKFKEIVDIRVMIKEKRFDEARALFDGKLAPYLDDPATAKNLANALKIAINSVYGLTSATFENPFHDIRNKNNIVALRGALFMVDLKEEIEKRGGTVIHIKTDSIKVVDPSDDLEQFILSFAKQYGYDFEIEEVFDRICLVNNAVYIAKLADDDPNDPGKWTATGTQFQVPYVFKTLFSHEPLIFEDMCEIKEVQTSMALDFNEGLEVGQHGYRYIGKVGMFCPIIPGVGAGQLMRKDKAEEKYSAVTGTKDFRWQESSIVESLGMEDKIDISYYAKLVDEAKEEISKYGPFDDFVNGVPLDIPFDGPYTKVG